jgi:hypothetical protein
VYNAGATCQKDLNMLSQQYRIDSLSTAAAELEVCPNYHSTAKCQVHVSVRALTTIASYHRRVMSYTKELQVFMEKPSKIIFSTVMVNIDVHV